MKQRSADIEIIIIKYNECKLYSLILLNRIYLD